MDQIKRRGNLIAIAVVAVLGLGYAGWVLNATGGLPSLHAKYSVKAVTPQAANLASGARVTAAGVEVGRVASIKRVGMGAVVKMHLDDNVAPLPRDSKIHVRQRTPVGENYVALNVGRSAKTLASGAVLPLSQPDDYVELDQVLSALQGPTRDRARVLIQSLGTALEGRGDNLNHLLSGANGTLQSLSSLANVVGRDRHQIKRLVASANRIMAGISERRGAIRRIASSGRTTFRALAERDSALTELLRVLPSTLTQVRTTARTLGRTSVTAEPVVRDLAGAVEDLAPTVNNLAPAARTGTSVVDELDAAISPLKVTLERARSLSPAAVNALPRLGSTLCEVNPMLRYVVRYRSDIASAISNMGSAANSYDAIGHLARVSAVTGENAISGLPPELSASLAALLHTGILSRSQGMTLDPYPQPGKIGATGLPSTLIQTTAELGQSGYPFERVTADC